MRVQAGSQQRIIKAMQTAIDTANNVGMETTFYGQMRKLAHNREHIDLPKIESMEEEVQKRKCEPFGHLYTAIKQWITKNYLSEIAWSLGRRPLGGTARFLQESKL